MQRGKGTALGNSAHKSASQKGASVMEEGWAMVETGRDKVHLFWQQGFKVTVGHAGGMEKKR